jgi:hypothetical protein
MFSQCHTEKGKKSTYGKCIDADYETSLELVGELIDKHLTDYKSISIIEVCNVLLCYTVFVNHGIL